MQLSEFKIGCIFLCDGQRYMCTDIGTRTVVAVQLGRHVEDAEDWVGAPPYALGELVFDEDDVCVCIIAD